MMPVVRIVDIMSYGIGLAGKFEEEEIRNDSVTDQQGMIKAWRSPEADHATKLRTTRPHQPSPWCRDVGIRDDYGCRLFTPDHRDALRT
jgi:hypothetical protein